ncbi:GNAT family N-acetyltransferase [Maritimibacter sp. DP1N21-5]|uniref:GNAT family N-acetyltransferase n=1 Tax=Maritimibacter sp. DP1N21-5 TaxID=2836867 RepID=UPI001C481A52|nr:GNAT family protein [Maritimibacter sp. DP1N21-5]MBV7410620.1 GNAT family N-acetyltransferase [Maritimibacter sp. DP1N21-5]
MFRRAKTVRIDTPRLLLRPLGHADFPAWRELRLASRDFLAPWEPTWAADHLERKGFTNRVNWVNRSINNGSAVPLAIIRRLDNVLLGAITLDNIRRGPAQSATVGYWIGEPYARHGYMREALSAVVDYAFRELDLSRIEAGCLPENAASRGVLEKCGFKYEGVAQSYLQINARWRTHVLYAALRFDRRGRTDAG